jgi:hypothetical protein
MQYEPNRIGFTSREYYIHPEFNAKTLNYDAAVIKLPFALNYNS